MKGIFGLATLVACSAAIGHAATYEPSTITPPDLAKEFRGAWLAEVTANPDWPSRPGLSSAEQKAELIALFDRAAQLHLNAILFQVRPACDAIYASSFEPWSEYLTGAMGRPPQPFYDPLAFAIEEAHKRGLELHAWFNPFRALNPQPRSPAAANHVSRTRPDLVRRYGAQLWLDPGEPDVRDFSMRAVMDVVKRYDIDGIHFDDYFYPYKEKDAAGRVLNFPDDRSWLRYGARSGLSRDDWRRDNINGFIQRAYQSIKSAKPWVKFGVSPFGIWRPGHPPPIKGLDAFADLYADSRLWLASGWVDYFAPQLYWADGQTEQSFSVLLDWWTRQNVKGRHLWPGLNAANVGERWAPDEIIRQIDLVRRQPGNGEIFFHLSSVTRNHSLSGAVAEAYAQPALVPPSPWLTSPPGKPQLTTTNNGWPPAVKAAWRTATQDVVRCWIVQTRSNGVWSSEILAANRTSRDFQGIAPEAIAVRAVDRAGNASPPAVLTIVAARAQPLPPVQITPPPAPPVQKRPSRKVTSPKNGGL